MTFALTLNETQVHASDGDTVLDVAKRNGWNIPTLCHHDDLPPVGSCRLCMVEVDGMHGEQAACVLPVHEGMVVRTFGAALDQSRRSTLQLLLGHYTVDGEFDVAQDCSEFMGYVRDYGAHVGAMLVSTPRYSEDSDSHPLIRVDLNQCILCTRCVRACDDVQGRFVWGVGFRGEHTKIIAGSNTSMLDADCESCGACVAYCPTGALEDRLRVDAEKPDRCVTTTCPYCGVGCNFDLEVKDNRIIGVRSRPDTAVNGNHLCVKGRYGHAFVHHPDRLTVPRVRRYLLDGPTRPSKGERGEWVDTDWETALEITATTLASIKASSGPDAIGVMASAKCTNEENYLMQKFARQVLGTHSVDHCARLCHSSTVAGLAMSLGSGAMTNTMRDIVEHANAILVIGSNTTEQHPVFGSMLRQAVRKRGVELVVADPRAIDLVEFSTLHIRQTPGTDVALVNGLMHIILTNGWQDDAFISNRTENLEALQETVKSYTPERVAEITGVSAEDLENVASLLAMNKPMAVIWAMGITQHTTGVMNVLSLANLQMLLGNLGVQGGGVNPLRGQNNVQGACDMGALPNVFPGYQSVTDRAAQEKFERAWALRDGDDESATPFSERPGLTVTEMVSSAGTGDVRALYILGENPVMTDPDVNHVRKCLAAAEFVVLQEIFPSETSEYADVLLPSTSWAEKSGAFTNTERRVQLIRPAIEAPGEARPDWAITAELARLVLACEHRTPVGDHANWAYTSPANVQKEIAALTPSYAGVSHDRLERGDQLHWPVMDFEHPGTPILHVGKFTHGKGRFHACEHLPADELPDSEFPLILTTGRVLYHWHGGEMTRRVPGLIELYPETLLEVCPDDATKLGLSANDLLRIRSRRGEMLARAMITERVAPGLVFGNFHFPGTHNVNNLTIGALDPIAKIPEYKVCAVRIEAGTV